MTDVQDGFVELNGRRYMPDAKGALVPVELVKPQDSERDALVRSLMAEAEAVRQVIADFKAKAFDAVQAFLDLIDESYGAKARPGGEKGNVTLQTFDGLQRVTIQVADLIRFESAELQACKKCVDECIGEWSADSQAEIRAIVMNAFRVDKAGQINRAALLGLLRLDIQDPRWLEGMRALRDAIKVDGTKSYMRFYRRLGPQAAWQPVSLDAATA